VFVIDTPKGTVAVAHDGAFGEAIVTIRPWPRVEVISNPGPSANDENGNSRIRARTRKSSLFAHMMPPAATVEW
jgi:hypothetical protein